MTVGPPTTMPKASSLPAAAVPSRTRRSRAGALMSVLAKLGASAVVTVAVLTLITFFGTNLRPPEKAAVAALGHEASPEQIDGYIAANGLDRPVLSRYLDWISGVLQGDLGVSSTSRLPVVELIGERFAATVTLAAVALLLSLAVALPLGMYMARRAGTATDTALMTGSVALTAIPEFVIGILLAYFLAAKLGWFPINSSGLLVGGGSRTAAYVLPAVTLATSVFPYVARMTRASMRDALNTEAVRSATLRGLSLRRVRINHALRLAAVPIVGTVAISTTYLLGSVLVVEQVFGFPGLGQLTVSAVSQGDVPVLQGCALVIGTMIVVLNLVFEAISLQLNPKVKAALR